jgi:LPXTG-motif cell wall-anchored protein
MADKKNVRDKVPGMGYRVKTHEGELSFQSLADVASALKHQLVQPTDDVCDERDGRWIHIYDLVVFKELKPQTDRRSWVLYTAAGLMLIAALALLLVRRWQWSLMLTLAVLNLFWIRRVRRFVRERNTKRP